MHKKYIECQKQQILKIVANICRKIYAAISVQPDWNVYVNS